jgi:CIC family chloride channel protein
MLNAADVAMSVRALSAQESLATAIERMDQDDVDALPVMGENGELLGLITRAAIRRHLRDERSRLHAQAEAPVAATEV